MPHNLKFEDQLPYLTIRIECQNVDGTKSIGTGCHFRFRERGTKFIPCILTNRHVIAAAASATFRFHASTADGMPIAGKSGSVTITNFQAFWHGHPNPAIDLAVIPSGDLVTDLQGKGFDPFVIGVGTSLIPTQALLDGVTPVEDILMIGYPIGISDEVNNFPLIRRGITATHPKLNYNGRPEVMIDAACFPGSSGSPVFLWNMARRPVTIPGGSVIPNAMYLLGILQSGPAYTAEGTLEIVNIPTQQLVVPRSQIPVNLGIVLKSSLILDFENVIEDAMAKT